MKNVTEYGLVSTVKDEKQIFESLNSFLAPLQRKFAKVKNASYLKAYAPYKYKYIYSNLNKDMGTNMELFPNADTANKLNHPKQKDVAWILKVIIDVTSPGYQKHKTEKYIANLLKAVKFKKITLFESNKI